LFTVAVSEGILLTAIDDFAGFISPGTDDSVPVPSVLGIRALMDRSSFTMPLTLSLSA
jgi:hypothetical protein